MKRVVAGVVCAVALMLTGAIASAGTAMSAAAFQPAAGSEAAYLTSAGWYILNTDSTNNRGAVASEWNFWPATVVPFDVVVGLVGGTITCWVNYLDVTTGINHNNSASWSGTGFHVLPVYTPTGLTGSAYVVSLACSIPPLGKIYGSY